MRLVQNSFVGGEIAPELFGRHDTEAYFHAAKRIDNFLVRKTGGLRKRQGTQLMWHVSTEGGATYRAIPYFYDRTRAACVLIYRKAGGAAAYCRVCKEGEAAGSEAEIPAEVLELFNDDELAALQCKQVGDTLMLTALGKTAAKGAVDYMGGTVEWSAMSTPEPPAMPGEMTLAADGFDTDTSKGFRESTRYYGLFGVRNGVRSPVRRQGVGIYLYWVAGATVTIEFTPDFNTYDSYILCVEQAGQWGVLKEFYEGDEEERAATVHNEETDEDEETTETVCAFTDDNISATDIAGAMEALTVGDVGFDCAVADVWEQRMVFASSDTLPFTLWFSRAGDVANFYTDRPQTQDGAFSVTIPTLVSSRILHMVTSRWFLLLTESGEYMVGSSGNGGFAYNTITIRRTSNVGAHESIPPVTTEGSVLFVAADGRTVYELQYSLEQDSVNPTNRSMLAHHLTETSRIRKIAFAKFPEPTLLCLLEDGTIAVMTYVPSEKVFAWSRMSFAGGGLKCVDVGVPGSIREGDGIEGASEVWLTFTRENKPGDVWIERFRTAGVGDTQDVGKAKCADHCGYSAEDWPDGETDPQTAVAASVTTIRPEIRDFNTMGLVKNIHDCVIRLNRSGAVSIRPDADGLEAASSAAQTENAPAVSGEGDARTVALVTKDVKVLSRAFQNTDGRMVVASADEWPCNILSILFNIEVASEREEG